MGFWDDYVAPIGSFIKENKSVIEPIVSAGVGAIKQNSLDNSSNQYLNYLREREQRNYDNYVASANSLNATNAANAASRAAAANANDAARRGAAAKANKAERKMYKKLLALYSPLKDSAMTLLPQMQETYLNSLAMQGSMGQFLNKPEQMAKLNGALPAYQVNIPLPDSLKGR